MCITDVQRSILADTKKVEEVLNLNNMRKAIPEEAFKKDVVKSFYFFFFDYAMVSGSIYCLMYLNNSGFMATLPTWLQYVVAGILWNIAGFFMWGIFVVGHDCGHGTFSDNWLPDKVLWRRKEAFSDGCSSQERSWSTVIQEYVNDKITDEDSTVLRQRWKHNPPQLKESMYYRMIFEELYPNCDHTIPYYWLPKWSGEVADPSARVLSNYDTTTSMNKKTK